MSVSVAPTPSLLLSLLCGGRHPPQGPLLQPSTPQPSSKVKATRLYSNQMGLEQWRLCAPVLPTPGFSRAGTSPHLCVWIPSLTHSSHWFIYLAPAVCPALTDLLCLRQDLLAYLPKPLQWQVSMATIKSLIGQELRQLQGCSSQEAQIGFIGGSGARGLPGQGQVGGTGGKA